MNSTVVISIFFSLLVIVSLKCNAANKTELFIGVLNRNPRIDRQSDLGLQLAIDVAKNHSDFKDFLDKYEIKIKSYSTNVSYV